MSAACSSTGPRAAASAAPTAPDPQHRSTTIPGRPGTWPPGTPAWLGMAGAWPPGQVARLVAAAWPARPAAGPAGAAGWRAWAAARQPSEAAWRTRNSVRRRGTNTPGSTAIRRPQNSAQPRTCSRGTPAARRPVMAASSAGVRAAEMSSRASSSAKTQPAARSRAAVPDSGHGDGDAGMSAPSGPGPGGELLPQPGDVLRAESVTRESLIVHVVQPAPGVSEIPAGQARIQPPGKADELFYGVTLQCN